MLTFLAGLNAPAAVCLATSCCAAVTVPYFLLVGVDFDLRPVVRRALESGRYDRLLIAVAGARYHEPRHAAPRSPLAKRAARDAALTLAALLILTIPTGDHR